MKTKVIKVKSWSELPEVLKPGVYVVDGKRFIVKKTVEREFMRVAIEGIEELADNYY